MLLFIGVLLHETLSTSLRFMANLKPKPQRNRGENAGARRVQLPGTRQPAWSLTAAASDALYLEGINDLTSDIEIESYAK